MFVPNREHPPRVVGAEPKTLDPRPAMVFFIPGFDRTPDASPVRESAACTVGRLEAPRHADTSAILGLSSLARASRPASPVAAGRGVPGTPGIRER